ncbi:Glucan endo-1,3-beta-glucosidase 13 [Hibiscus syriacus]|uniref:glucan endo-1,3-beta-D-glucosidase n=1 Tax=Hibiscus syriacus TaxID=106335 RepID=A0A6A3ARU5_HIBSY|nr:Glucan endo-1,3-beta-glucosidase 13 [Hibiscus syriacus]
MTKAHFFQWTMSSRFKLAFVVSFLLLLLDCCKGSFVGVCYGRNADDLPTPDKVANWCNFTKSNTLGFMIPISKCSRPLPTRASSLWWEFRIRTLGLEVTESPDNASALVVPAMQNVFKALKRDSPNNSLDYDLFESSSEVIDPNTGLLYTNMFNAQIDALYFALMALNFRTIWVMVTETGWPSKGLPKEKAATTDNAQTYNDNLIRHVINGSDTPAKPGEELDPSQPCFEPDNTLSHASFTFNNYYQQNGATDVACSFGGNGVKVDKNPRYDNCIYVTTRGVNKTATTAIARSSSSSRRTEVCTWVASFFLMILISFILDPDNMS